MMIGAQPQDLLSRVLALASILMLVLSCLTVAFMAVASLVVIYGILGILLEGLGDWQSTLAGTLCYVGAVCFVRAFILLMRHRKAPANLNRQHVQTLLLPLAAWSLSTVSMPLSPILPLCGLPYLLALAGFALMARRQRHLKTPNPTP